MCNLTITSDYSYLLYARNALRGVLLVRSGTCPAVTLIEPTLLKFGVLAES